jgi:hypothetical protein
MTETSSVVLQTLSLESDYFGPGGSRRGTHYDDLLRQAYISTRLSLLEHKLETAPPAVQRGDEYFELRSKLLKRGFSKRKTNREVILLGLQREEEEKRNENLKERLEVTPVALPREPPKPKRYKVVDEYAFTGMHKIFDHHKTSVSRLAFANGDRSRLAMCCNDGSVSIASTEGELKGEIYGLLLLFCFFSFFLLPDERDAYRFVRFPKLTKLTKKCGAAVDICWSLTNEWLLVGYAGGYVV